MMIYANFTRAESCILSIIHHLAHLKQRWQHVCSFRVAWKGLVGRSIYRECIQRERDVFTRCNVGGVWLQETAFLVDNRCFFFNPIKGQNAVMHRP